MEVIDRIHNCKNDEQLYWLTKKLIKEAYNRTKQYNTYKGLIGARSEVNKTGFDFDPNSKRGEYSYNVPFWNGYVPLNTKIVYGNKFDKYYDYDSNGGRYYYVDDDSYVYEFIKQLNDWDVENCFDLLSVINGFCLNLFVKTINSKDRSQIHKLILKDDQFYFEPIKEHSIKDFYGNGSAVCTEYALVVCNLLNVLGVPTYYCMDKKHAYNIFFAKIDGMEDDYNGYLLDFSDNVLVVDEKFNYVGSFPFYLKLDIKKKKYLILPKGEYLEIGYKKDLEQIKEEDGKYILLPNGDYIELDETKEKSNIEEFNEYFDKVVNDEKRIKTKDYFVEIINNKMYKFPSNEKREYGIDCNSDDEVKILTKRKERW